MFEVEILTNNQWTENGSRMAQRNRRVSDQSKSDYATRVQVTGAVDFIYQANNPFPNINTNNSERILGIQCLAIQ